MVWVSFQICLTQKMICSIRLYQSKEDEGVKVQGFDHVSEESYSDHSDKNKYYHWVVSKERFVSWGIILQDVVAKVVSRVEKEKPSPINWYLFHLYSQNECLREEETVELETAKTMLMFNVVPEADEHSKIPYVDSKRESFDAEEI